jgi:hypothetical protein
VDRNLLNEHSATSLGDASHASSEIDRRKLSRRMPAETESLSRVRLRLGSELAVINVSDAGILVDGVCRLSPGSRVDVHVVTTKGRVLIRATVARAHVSALQSDSLRYRAALIFDQTVDTRPTGG